MILENALSLDLTRTLGFLRYIHIYIYIHVGEQHSVPRPSLQPLTIEYRLSELVLSRPKYHLRPPLRWLELAPITTMASSLQGTIVAGSSARQPCYFLERLPLELRQQIYGYLLGAKCTKHEHDLNSVEVSVLDLSHMDLTYANPQQYNNQRNQLMIGPDHYYEFQPAVLALNHQIRMEAGELFRRGNTFIRLVMFPNITTSTRDYLRDYSDIEDGLAIIARGNTTRHFPDIAMTLAFDDQPDVAGSGSVSYIPAVMDCAS